MSAGMTLSPAEEEATAEAVLAIVTMLVPSRRLPKCHAGCPCWSYRNDRPTYRD